MDKDRIDNIYQKSNKIVQNLMNELDKDNHFISHLELWKNNIKDIATRKDFDLKDFLECFGCCEEDYLYQDLIEGTTDNIHPFNPMMMAILMNVDLTKITKQDFFDENKQFFLFDEIECFWQNFVKLENFAFLPVEYLIERHEFVTQENNRKHLVPLLINKYTEEVFGDSIDLRDITPETKDLWHAVKKGYKPNMNYFERLYREMEPSKLLDNREFADAIFDYINNKSLNDDIAQHIENSDEERNFKEYFEKIIENHGFLVYLYSIF